MASSRNEKLHRTVLNRCLPIFVRDLDINAVFDYLYLKNLFDEITLRDIKEEKTTSDKIRQLIYRLQQRDQDTYEKFKDCLVLSKQEHLKQILEEEEGKVTVGKDKTQGKARGQDNVTVTTATRNPVASKSEVLHVKAYSDNGKPFNIYSSDSLWMKLSETSLSQTQTTAGLPVNRREYMQRSREKQSSNYPLFQTKNHDLYQRKKRDMQVAIEVNGVMQQEAFERDGVMQQEAFERDGVMQQEANERDGVMQQEAFERDGVMQQEANERDGVMQQEAFERDGVTQQNTSSLGIYTRATQIQDDLKSGRKSKECNPQQKRTKQVMLQIPIVKERVSTVQFIGPKIKHAQLGSLSARGGNTARQGTTLCISGLSGGRSATFYLEENQTNQDGAARGAPNYSSAKPIHHSRSSNAVLEGTGKQYKNTSNLISPMSSVSLQGTEYVLKEHFDVCITYCETDENDAYEFKDHLETLDLGLGEHPKICLYTEEKVWGPIKLTEKPKFVCKHCTLIFVYLSKRSSEYEYANFFRDEVIMATIKNCRVRPVLSEKDCIIPTGLNNVPKIELYKRESRSYKENILNLFIMNKSERLRREAEGIESILSTL